MPRLIAGGPGKRKFWHAWVDGTELVVKFGKLGSQGDEQTKSFETTEAASTELAKLVKQKLAKGYEDNAWTYSFDDSGLSLREVVDLPPRPEDATLARELVGLREGSWSGFFWHGDYTLGLDKDGAAFTAGLIDRMGARPRWRPFDPPIRAASFANGFDSSARRFIIATGSGPAFIFDCKTLGCATVGTAGDEIKAVALLNDFAALLRKNTKGTQLELYALADGKAALAKTIPCHRQDTLAPFGDGRGLIVSWNNAPSAFDGKTWPNTHFLGVAKDDAWLLGTCGLSVAYAYEKSGRSMIANAARGNLEILDFDAALERASKKDAVVSLT